MLRTFASEPPILTFDGFVPCLVRPLLHAAEQRVPVTPAFQQLVARYGFEHFMYAVGTSPRPSCDTRAYVWTSMPAPWLELYKTRGFIETDPRLHAAWNSALPVLWDRQSFPDTRANLDFLAAAAEFGVHSGVTFALRNRFDVPGVFSFNSSLTAHDEARTAFLTSVLGELMTIATWVHDVFLTTTVPRYMPEPVNHPLSLRERECLQLAARGMSSREIAAALHIGHRTVHTHFDKLLAKLGAANRDEGIAKASAAGLIAAG